MANREACERLGIKALKDFAVDALSRLDDEQDSILEFVDASVRIPLF